MVSVPVWVDDATKPLCAAQRNATQRNTQQPLFHLLIPSFAFPSPSGCLQAWFRYLFGWMMPPNHSVLKRTQTEELRKLYEMHHVVQDMLVPISKLDETLDVQQREFGVYPLWICPMRIFKEDAGFIKPTAAGEEMFVDVGIYGVPTVDFHPRKNLVNVEHFVRKVQGFQMLYADMYQTREEFRQMFDHTLYDKMRKKLGCDKVLPDVYDKTCKANRF